MKAPMVRARFVFRLFVAASGITAVAFGMAACGSSGSNFYGGVDAGNGTGAQDSSSSADASIATQTDATPTDAGTDSATDASTFVWPDCTTQPPSTTKVALTDIWQSYDTATPKGVFVQSVHITAISGAACRVGATCQFFVQDSSYASLEAGAHHAIKVFVSAATSHYFTSLEVGDQVDVSGYAWRYTVDSENELLIEVNSVLPGCAYKTGTGAIAATSGVNLSDFSVQNYEHAVGPLLVSVAGVSGKYEGPPNATFGLYETGFDGGFAEAGSDAGTDIVSLSPFFLPTGNFIGLSQGQVTSFQTITGVFDVFYAGSDAGTAVKYLELGPRTTADIVAN